MITFYIFLGLIFGIIVSIITVTLIGSINHSCRLEFDSFSILDCFVNGILRIFAISVAILVILFFFSGLWKAASALTPTNQVENIQIEKL